MRNLPELLEYSICRDVPPLGLCRSDPRLSRSTPAGPAASTHIWPRRAARPSGATPLAHATRRSLSAPTMRCASLAPERLGPTSAHNACHLPIAGEAAAIEEPRDAAAAARCPPLHRANPPDCPHSLPARERDTFACQSLPGSSPSAEDTRECAGDLVAAVTPRRAARRCGSDLAQDGFHSTSCPAGVHRVSADVRDNPLRRAGRNSRLPVRLLELPKVLHLLELVRPQRRYYTPPTPLTCSPAPPTYLLPCPRVRRHAHSAPPGARVYAI